MWYHSREAVASVSWRPSSLVLQIALLLTKCHVGTLCRNPSRFFFFFFFLWMCKQWSALPRPSPRSRKGAARMWSSALFNVSFAISPTLLPSGRVLERLHKLHKEQEGKRRRNVKTNRKMCFFHKGVRERWEKKWVRETQWRDNGLEREAFWWKWVRQTRLKKREFDKLTAGSHCYAGNLTMEVVRFVKMEL